MTEDIAEKEINTPVAPTKIEITLHGREYTVVCDPAEKDKLDTIIELVEKKLEDVSTRGTNNSEVRMFMLACLVLADELIETRKQAEKNRQADEKLMVTAVDHLRQRILSISEKIGEE